MINEREPSFGDGRTGKEEGPYRRERKRASGRDRMGVERERGKG